jgi:hypothetical protein
MLPEFKLINVVQIDVGPKFASSQCQANVNNRAVVIREDKWNGTYLLL